jgi:uncharacterized ion transporter superfamily protein YfcC
MGKSVWILGTVAVFFVGNYASTALASSANNRVQLFVTFLFAGASLLGATEIVVSKLWRLGWLALVGILLTYVGLGILVAAAWLLPRHMYTAAEIAGLAIFVAGAGLLMLAAYRHAMAGARKPPTLEPPGLGRHF